MNRFEFSRNLSMGQYIPGDSVLHRFDPRVKILAGILLIFTATVVRNPWGLLQCLLIGITGVITGRYPFQYLLKSILIPAPFLLLIAALQIFIHAPVENALVSWGFIQFGWPHLIGAGTLILRFIVLIILVNLLTSMLSTRELVVGLENLFKPLAAVGIHAHDFVMMIQITFRFFPVLAQSAEQIAKSQAARGADWDRKGFDLFKQVRNVLPLIIPLFITSLRKAEMMALAMDSRGYGISKERTIRHQLKYQSRDIVVLTVVGLACLLMLFL